ncbi:MAG: hypothetical protein H6819_09405 [Phycisphaerales bacterium]|nr:hypothetical protein [Phycisphaerales bacterium]MCB9855432.1 hypothetical protein [Phycisphaerales bacterium]
MKDPHLISVDELRAAGALDVPKAWRKSLGDDKQSGFIPGLFDDDAHTDGDGATQVDSDDDVGVDADD